MMALNFQAKKHEELIMSRKKNCTVRLGDVRNQYPESSIAVSYTHLTLPTICSV